MKASGLKLDPPPRSQAPPQVIIAILEGCSRMNKAVRNHRVPRRRECRGLVSFLALPHLAQELLHHSGSNPPPGAERKVRWLCPHSITASEGTYFSMRHRFSYWWWGPNTKRSALKGRRREISGFISSQISGEHAR